MKRVVFLFITLAIITMLASCGVSKEVKDCIELINQIDEVTLDSENAILAAEEAYASLSDEEKEQMEEEAQILSDSRTKYDELVKEEEDRKSASAVIALIDSIGTVTLDSEDAIDTANSMYNKLSAEAKEMVTNYDILKTAKNDLSSLQAAEKDRIFNEYVSKFNVEEDNVEGITWYTHNDTPYYINERSYINPYIGDRGTFSYLCVRYNYTGSSWIFWDNLKIVVDGKTYTISCNYFDVVRENNGGSVWEYYDDIPDNEKDTINMLEKIAESNETIIRFQGGDHVYDLVVSDTDKAIIRDVLTLYEAMKY